MNTFADYLAGLGLAPSTVRTYTYSVDGLSAWTEREGLTLPELTYLDLTAWLRALNGCHKTRALHLTAVRHLFGWMVASGERRQNPALHVQVRGVRRPLPSGLLSEEQLRTVVAEYDPTSPTRARNKAMLGVLAYQGLDAGELARLEVEAVDLEAGLLSVPGSRTSEGRVLALEGRQVLTLHRYLVEGRATILKEAGKESARLFVSAGCGTKLNNTLSLLVQELKGRYAWFENVRQLRASRIALWLRVYDLREVQYLAGHRYVSSTERYRAADLDGLHRALARHHPLG